MSEEAGEKSLPPTPKRRQDAARRGDVLRSRDLATAVAFGTGAAGLLVVGPWMVGSLLGGARRAMVFDTRDLAGFDAARAMLPPLLTVMQPLLLLGGSVALATLAVQLACGEGRFVPANLSFKVARLDPLAGMRRMLGLHGVVELGKSLVKLLVLLSFAWGWGIGHLAKLFAIARSPLEAQVAIAWHAIGALLLYLSAGLVLVAFIDWPIEWLRRNNRLKMTQQEARDEHKETEGSPEKKAAVRQRQRSMARGGVIRAVNEADLILVNPAHFAVALVYDTARASAPVLLAKGRDGRALAMRDLAAELGKPVLEYPALTRAVYFTTQEHQMVREELYAAIATVLAFVMALKRGERRKRPQVHLPPAFRYDAAGKAQIA
ncbi:flagellar biosynthesis protein FlhB [Porphyrobacter sp. GA68]|uniref:EscU/YscU/HrcU family type III secretion system export apparatus switch protein n=1 Tax=Porphyrobacter sp. GA68 TaxID=2883480 RepID=UPI001D18AE2A|nr:EscU/YscU/HrcU family type III secretion system export apparatus switch protein [Porphyrobacter sp. GA68]